MKVSKIDQKKKEAARSVLCLKMQMNALKAEISSVEDFLLESMKPGEVVDVKEGKVYMLENYPVLIYSV